MQSQVPSGYELNNVKIFIMQVTKETTHLVSCQSSRVYFLWCLGEAGILILGSSVGMHWAASFSSTTLTDETSSTWYPLFMVAIKHQLLGT